MKKLDRTSVVMIVIFSVIILAAVAGLVFAAVKPEKAEDETEQPIDVTEIAEENGGMLTVEDILKAVPNAEPGSTYSYYDDNGNIQSVTIPMDIGETEQTADNSSKFKFTEFTDLSDKFLEVCRAGDVDSLYNMYYGDFLDRARLSMDPVQSKTEFDRGIKSNMLSVTGFDEYEYGCVEMPPTQSAGAYAAQIYYNLYEEKIPLDISTVENCVDLVVYIDNMYQTHHFMVKIDGYWYFVV